MVGRLPTGVVLVTSSAKLAKPTLVIAGTDDNYDAAHGNALVLAGKIPGAWLVQIIKMLVMQ